MEKSMMKGITIAGIAMLALAAAVMPGCKAVNELEYAEVVDVKEITETIETPREECKDVPVQQQAPTKDPNRALGKVIGGVAGGVVGYQFGGGAGKAVATALGAVGGAYVGDKVQNKQQKSNVVTTTKRVCKTVYDKTEKLVGYDVTYRYKGNEGVIRTSFRPGATLPVENGQVVVIPPVATQ